jgi:hypothetical protein
MTLVPPHKEIRRCLQDPLTFYEILSARIGIVQLFAFLSSVIVAYTNDGYLRDAYRCLQMPTDEPGYAQMSHRDLWKPSCGDSEYPVFGRYKGMYISPFR